MGVKQHVKLINNGTVKVQLSITPVFNNARLA